MRLLNVSNTVQKFYLLINRDELIKFVENKWVNKFNKLKQTFKQFKISVSVNNRTNIKLFYDNYLNDILINCITNNSNIEKFIIKWGLCGKPPKKFITTFSIDSREMSLKLKEMVNTTVQSSLETIFSSYNSKESSLIQLTESIEHSFVFRSV